MSPLLLGNFLFFKITLLHSVTPQVPPDKSLSSTELVLGKPTDTVLDSWIVPPFEQVRPGTHDHWIAFS